MTMTNLNAFDPPTLDTLARYTRRFRVFGQLAAALKAHRAGDHDTKWLHWARADAAVHVLYDLGYGQAFEVLHRVEQVRKILEQGPCVVAIRIEAIGPDADEVPRLVSDMLDEGVFQNAIEEWRNERRFVITSAAVEVSP